MAANIPDIIAHFKADVGQALSAAVILETCRRFVYKHCEQILGPVATAGLLNA